VWFVALTNSCFMVCLNYSNYIPDKELVKSYLFFVMFCYTLFLSRIAYIFAYIIYCISHNTNKIFIFLHNNHRKNTPEFNV